MSTKYVYICDHCGAECTDKFEFSLFGRWARKDAQYIPDNVHGCTREHTVLAVAKILGIGVDGKAVELLAAKDARIAELTKQRDEEHGLAQLRAIEIDTWKKELAEARERINELESRPDATEVLQKVRDRIYDDGYRIYEDDSNAMSVIDTACAMIDAEFASLTGPKKPTKPVINVEVRGNIDAEALQKLQAYIRDEIEGES
jgi:hypothetical protein